MTRLITSGSVPSGATVDVVELTHPDNATQAELDTHAADTSTHGIADTADLALKSHSPRHLNDYPAIAPETDDTGRFERAADAAIAAGGVGVVQIPEGTFTVDGVDYRSDVIYRGAGIDKTRIKLKSTSTGAIFGQGSGFPKVESVVFEDMWLDGDVANSTASGGAAALLHTYQAQRVTCRRVLFSNGRGYGFGAQGSPAAADATKRGEQRDFLFESCVFLNNGAATGADGLDIKSSERVTMTDCLAEGNSDKGFNIRGRYVTLIACRAYNNGSGFDLNANATITTTTTLASNIDASVTTIPLVSAAHLPPTGQVKIDSEWIRYEGISSNDLTGCIRSYGSSAAAAHSSGATVTAMETDSYHQLFGCVAEGNTSSGIAASATENSINHIALVACQARYNGGNGLITTAPPAGGKVRLTVHGGHYVGNTLRGIGVTNADVMYIDGPVCHSNGEDGCRLTDQTGGRVSLDAR